MKNIKILKLTKEEHDYFQSFYTKHKVVGYLMYELDTPSGPLPVGHVIVKMKKGYKGWTPYGTARDCGKYYILSTYGGFEKLDKKTLSIEYDVEDK